MTSARQRYGGLGLLGASVAVAGVAGYGLLVVCGRFLGPADFAVLLAYWGLVFGLGGVSSTLEQEVSRQAALEQQDGRGRSRETWLTLSVALALALLLSGGLLVPPLADRLLAGQARIGPLVVVVTLGHTVQFCLRGLLLGHGRLRAYSTLFVGEAGVRVLAAGVVGVLGFAGVLPFAVAIALGGFVWIAGLPALRTRPEVVRNDDEVPVTRVVRRVFALMAGALLTSSVVTGYPALVSALVPELRGERLGTFFAALTVARTPLLAVAPLQTIAVPTLVRVLAGPDARRRLHRLLAQGALSGVTLAVAGGCAGAVLGPAVVRLLYGSEYQVASWTVAALVASSVLLAGLLLSCAVLVALDAHDWVPLVWGATSGSTALALLFAPGSPEGRAVAGLLVGPVVGLALALVSAQRRSPGVAPGPKPVPVPAVPKVSRPG